MNNLFSDAKYINGMNGTPVAIIVNVGDSQTMTIPMDAANTDYANIMALVEAGELTIAPAEGG
jgi:hypothetical protein